MLWFSKIYVCVVRCAWFLVVVDVPFRNRDLNRVQVDKDCGRLLGLVVEKESLTCSRATSLVSCSQNIRSNSRCMGWSNAMHLSIIDLGLKRLRFHNKVADALFFPVVSHNPRCHAGRSSAARSWEVRHQYLYRDSTSPECQAQIER